MRKKIRNEWKHIKVSLVGKSVTEENCQSGSVQEAYFSVIRSEKIVSELVDFNGLILVAETEEKELRRIVRYFEKHGIENYVMLDEFKDSLHARSACIYEKWHPNIKSSRKILAQLIMESIEEFPALQQDSSSEVEFYLVDSMEITHFLPFYHALVERGVRASFVAEPAFLNTSGKWFDYEVSYKKLKKQGVVVNTVANPEAAIAVTTQYPRNLAEYQNIKIQMYYGVQVLRRIDFFLHPEVAKGFDYQLVHGPFSKEKLDAFMPSTHTLVMGYPRYIDYFRECTVAKENGTVSKIGKTSKPVLVYFPTWDEYSSIQNYADAIGALRDTFHVIIKPHHCTWRLPEKVGDKEKLIANADRILEGTYSLAECAQMADIAVCDGRSGVVSEVAYLRPELPMVCIMDKVQPEEMEYDLTKFAAGVRNPSMLREIVIQTYKHDDYVEDRKKMLEYLYAKDTEACFKKVIDFFVLKVMDKRNTGSSELGEICGYRNMK